MLAAILVVVVVQKIKAVCKPVAVVMEVAR